MRHKLTVFFGFAALATAALFLVTTAVGFGISFFGKFEARWWASFIAGGAGGTAFGFVLLFGLKKVFPRKKALGAAKAQGETTPASGE
jgi:hypothetical protein